MAQIRGINGWIEFNGERLPCTIVSIGDEVDPKPHQPVDIPEVTITGYWVVSDNFRAWAEERISFERMFKAINDWLWSSWMGRN